MPPIDEEILLGHLLLAGIDQRFEDMRALAAECEKRGLISAGLQSQMEERLSKLGPLDRMIGKPLGA